MLRSGARFLIPVVAALLVLAPSHQGIANADEKHFGDIVLQGNQTFELIGTTYWLHGSLEVSGSARVELRDSVLILAQSYLDEFPLEFSGDSSLLLVDSLIVSDYEVDLHFWERASARVERSQLGATAVEPKEGDHNANVSFNGDSSCEVIDSDLLVCPLGFRFSDRASLVSRNSVHSLHLLFGESCTATLRSLEPRQYESWSVGANCDVQGESPSVELTDSHVDAWSISAQHSAEIIIHDSDLVWISADNGSSIELHDCRVFHTIELDMPADGSCIESLASGWIEAWEWPRGDLRPQYRIHNTTVGAWGGSAWSVGSGPFGLGVESASSICADMYTTTIVNGIVPQMHLGEGAFGALECNDVRFGYAHAPFNCLLEIKGTMAFEEETLRTYNHPWMNSSILRDYMVVVTNSEGVPAVGTSLRLLAPDGVVVWEGQTDLQGLTSFRILFDDANHEHTWTLEATDSGSTSAVRLLSETPTMLRIP